MQSLACSEYVRVDTGPWTRVRNVKLEDGLQMPARISEVYHLVQPTVVYYQTIIFTSACATTGEV
jgi:hypothetical protein